MVRERTECQNRERLGKRTFWDGTLRCTGEKGDEPRRTLQWRSHSGRDWRGVLGVGGEGGGDGPTKDRKN